MRLTTWLACAALAAIGVTAAAQGPGQSGAPLVPQAAAAPPPSLPPVTAADLAQGLEHPSRWLTYSGDYTGRRHSPLAQITPGNASRLAAQWTFQAEGMALGRGFEMTPLMMDGILYITGNNNMAWAIDARTGQQLWRYRRPLPAGLTYGGGNPSNRGFAMLGDLLFMGTLDAHLVALDRNTGRVAWDVVVDDFKVGHALIAAPLVVEDKVIVGNSGGDLPTRGFLDAYDAKTGARVWRFYTIPGPGEPGSETWSSPDVLPRGGGATWVTGSYDPELNLIYWGTGNPNPDYYGGDRLGNNLYTASLIAVDADTGTLKWHYQFTPHDLHDWDSNHIPVLADVTIGGRARKAVMVANRNGFFYALDRATGELLLGKPYTGTKWAREIGPNGPIVLNDGVVPPGGSEATTQCLPDLRGGTVYNPPSYDPALQLFFVMARETCAFYTPQKQEFQPGRVFMSGGMKKLPEDWGALRALDPRTGEVKWEHKFPTSSLAGVMSTASGVVFAGDQQGYFNAFDSRSGRKLWSYRTGSPIWGGAAITYTLDGRQFVLIPSGSTIVAFALPEGIVTAALRRRPLRRGVIVVCWLVGATVSAQNRNSPPPPPLPMTVFTAEQPVRVVPVVTGLSHPWGLAFLPDGSMLVTERPGRLRMIRGSGSSAVLDPQPISGVPAVRAAVLGGLLDVALHPKFAENGWLYLAYSKPRADGLTTTALARGRLDGTALRDVTDIFVANSWSKSSTNYGGRIVFDRNGFLFLTVGERQEPERAQKPDDHGGKVLRLRDDGSAPPDNPFAGRAGYLPEIYTLGHRSPQGLAIHPVTGAIWENEHGPLGGDEINILQAGKNYGWPLVTFGNDYDGKPLAAATARPDLEAPFIYWVPSLGISGLSFYTGGRFPAWTGNAFVGALMEGRTRGTGHVRRITFNESRPVQREPILLELRQRIRDVRPGPDGFLYVLTDEDNGAVLRLEPAPQLSSANQAGVAMGHLHFRVKDVEANRRFWTTLGGVSGSPGSSVGAAFRRPEDGPTAIVELTDAIVFLTQGEPSGVSDGAVLNHAAFRVPSLAAVEAAGLKVERLAGFPGVAYVRTPEGERVELFEDAAKNLTFAVDGVAAAKGPEARHNRPVAGSLAMHHVHLYLPDAAAVSKAVAWYAKTFGGLIGKRSNYDAVDLPGINFNFSANPNAVKPTRGRMLDHIGFEVTNLAAFCTQLESMGVTLDTPYRKHADGTADASLTDPWGTSIELTEGLRSL